MEIGIVLRMLLAAVLGGIVGLEREISRKEGGLRICVLVAAGTALFTALAVESVGGGHGGVPRGSAFPAPALAMSGYLLGYLVVALGLLGAGIIVRERFTAHGLTNAAVVWCVGGVGAAAGSGYYLTALAASILLVALQALMKLLGKILEKHGNIFVYIISTGHRASVIMDIKKIVLELDIKYIDAGLRKHDGGYEIRMAVTTSHNKNQGFIERIMQIPDVTEITSENV